jgi:hypothetical protein
MKKTFTFVTKSAPVPCSPTLYTESNVNLSREEPRSLDARLITVIQVRRCNNQSTLADQISLLAVHGKTITRVVDDLAVVLLVLGVSKERCSNNLVTD